MFKVTRTVKNKSGEVIHISTYPMADKHMDHWNNAQNGLIGFNVTVLEYEQYPDTDDWLTFKIERA